MRPQDFKRWRKAQHLSQKQAAEALGLKRRVVQYYEKGERDGEKVKIPRTVRLACAALSQGLGDWQPAPAKPAAKRPTKPQVDKPKTEKPKTEKPKTEKPKTEKSKAEKPKPGKDKAEKPKSARPKRKAKAAK